MPNARVVPHAIFKGKWKVKCDNPYAFPAIYDSKAAGAQAAAEKGYSVVNA